MGNDPEGQPNTLMREISGIDPTTSNTVITSGPICYNVLSFGLLYWDHSLAKNPSANPWQTEWPPVTTSPLTVAPSSVYMRISVYAGTPYSLTDLPANLQIETVSITTMVNVEAVLADPTYVARRTAVPVATSP